MRKSDINPRPPNFAKYIDLVDDVELEQAFDEIDRGIETHTPSPLIFSTLSQR